MHRNKSKLAAVALVTAMVLGVPRLQNRRTAEKQRLSQA
jgi:hypothetical protein